MLQMKEVGKFSAKEHNEMKAKNLPDSEVKTIVIKIVKEFS